MWVHLVSRWVSPFQLLWFPRFHCLPSPDLTFQNAPLFPPWPQTGERVRFSKRGVEERREESKSETAVKTLVFKCPHYEALHGSCGETLGQSLGTDPMVCGVLSFSLASAVPLLGPLVLSQVPWLPGTVRSFYASAHPKSLCLLRSPSNFHPF